MQTDYLFIALFVISSLLIATLFFRTGNSAAVKLVLLLAGDSGLVFFYIFYLSVRVENHIGPVILFCLLNIIASHYIFGGNWPDEKTAEKFSEDAANWKARLFYFNRDDNRLFVSKRYGFGPTLNFGNPYASFVVLCVVVYVLSL